MVLHSMNIILMHGKDTNPEEKWYPWFKEAVLAIGSEFCAPALPSADNPVMDEWLDVLRKCKPDEDTVLVGHSRGGIAIMRYLEQLESGLRVKAVVLIAANSGSLKDRAVVAESNMGFYTEEGYDFVEITSHCDTFFVLHSEDDHVVPFSNGEKNATGLGVELLSFTKYRHFGSDVHGVSIKEIPELIEIIKSIQ